MAWGDIPEWAEIISQSLLESMKERDPYTYGHCMRVGRNAKLLAKAAGLNAYEQKILYYAGMFHDLGKMGIPDRVLLKQGRLNEEEEAIMRTHPEKSVEIVNPLTSIPFFKALIPGILSHHERIDGAGYPHGLQEDEISLEARIVTIVDTFDAMTTNRPYRKGRGDEIAYKELKQFAGRQFDPQLVKVFLEAHPTWGAPETEITQEFIASHFRRAA